MANITATMVKDLREMTGAGMMDCKAALGETSGDMEAAVDWLRKKGLSKAAKKAGRVAAEGLIGRMLAPKKGAMVEVNSETDCDRCRRCRPGSGESGEGHFGRQVPPPGQARSDDREDYRIRAENLLQGADPAGAAVHLR